MRKKNLILMATATFLASCIGHDNLYDPNRVKEDAKANFPVQNIDPNQDWATRGTRTLDVTVNEKAGQTYTIKVFTANPFLAEANARLLAQSEMKNGEKLSLAFDVSLALDYVYVMCKAGEKDYLVSAAPLVGDRFIASFGKTAGTRAGSYELPGGIDIDKALKELPEGDWPSGIQNIGNDRYMFAGIGEGNYHLKDDITFFSGMLVSTNQHIYISGTLRVPSIKIEKTGSLTVLPGAKLILTSLINLTIDDNAIFYNAGTVEGASMAINQQAKWLNEGTYKGSSFLVQAAAVAQNNCKVEVKNVGLLSGTFNNGGSVKCTEFIMKLDANLNLSGKSVLEVQGDANFGTGTVTGPAAKPFPLIKANKFSQSDSEEVTVKNTVYATGGVSDFLATKFKVVKVTIGAIPEDGCVPPVEIEGDDTEDTPLSGCTIGFEDVNLKSKTDYDFNDIVIWVSNSVKESDETTYSYVYLVAAGATNNIKVGYTTAGGSSAYLFEGKEVHELLGITTKEMFNTSGDVVTEGLPFEKIQVAQPMLSGLNFFIEVNGDKDNLIYSKNNKEYSGSVPFALCVSEDWNFPVERTKINEAYDGFGEWGQNMNSNKTWYKNGKADLVRPFNSALLNKKK